MLQKHVAECPKRQMKCNLCGSVVTLEETDGHAKESCTQRVVACPYKCDKENIIAADLDVRLFVLHLRSSSAVLLIRSHLRHFHVPILPI